MSLTGKIYAITGGASGIGLATAKLLSSRGATVCIADVDAAALEEASTSFTTLPSKPVFTSTKVDVSNKDQVDAWITGIKAQFGRLDGAANIAGTIGRDHGTKPLAEQSDDEWSKIMGVNLTGMMHCLRAELGVIEDKGSIVNMASIHGTVGLANHAAYAASKHGVLALTKAAAKENGAREVRVNAVAPGPIYTPLMEKYLKDAGVQDDAPFDEPIAFRRYGTAEEVANVVVFLLGPESSFVSGSCYAVDGAWL
ncbi:short chain dehydrogenase/ reductase [Plectosphaerella cucumerina]|uniref:Short chain dehydrogenase/ reductase n=1 Tax=Plectosphaerella cucumerina TaxID=40658 RepID=A0A8K0WZG0_9PEZI|nr:short chain dehydrogenase/ reductase [Plectosphaerella cucumerina]